jgi:hypothetical protein
MIIVKMTECARDIMHMKSPTIPLHQWNGGQHASPSPLQFDFLPRMTHPMQQETKENKDDAASC